DESPDPRDHMQRDLLPSSFFCKAREIQTVSPSPEHIPGSVRNAPSNYLRLPMVPTLLGFDPMVQVIHELDVIDAIVCALRPGARGIFNVTGPGELPLSAILRELERPVLPFPHPVARPLLSALWRCAATSFAVAELALLRHVCVGGGARARTELASPPRSPLKEPIGAVLAV